MHRGSKLATSDIKHAIDLLIRRISIPGEVVIRPPEKVHNHLNETLFHRLNNTKIKAAMTVDTASNNRWLSKTVANSKIYLILRITIIIVGQRNNIRIPRRWKNSTSIRSMLYICLMGQIIESMNATTMKNHKKHSWNPSVATKLTNWGRVSTITTFSWTKNTIHRLTKAWQKAMTSSNSDQVTRVLTENFS